MSPPASPDHPEGRKPGAAVHMRTLVPVFVRQRCDSTITLCLVLFFNFCVLGSSRCTSNEHYINTSDAFALMPHYCKPAAILAGRRFVRSQGGAAVVAAAI